MTDTSNLESKVRAALREGGDLAERLRKGVEAVAEGFSATTCTLHEARPGDRVLELRAQHGLPEHLVTITKTIPFGKGMAGICAERREPVTSCNLQRDETGVVRPRARETGVAGAIVVPVFRGDRLAATIGVGMKQDHEYSPAEEQVLASCGAILLEPIYQQ